MDYLYAILGLFYLFVISKKIYDITKSAQLEDKFKLRSDILFLLIYIGLAVATIFFLDSYSNTDK